MSPTGLRERGRETEHCFPIRRLRIVVVKVETGKLWLGSLLYCLMADAFLVNNSNMRVTHQPFLASRYLIRKDYTTQAYARCFFLKDYMVQGPVQNHLTSRAFSPRRVHDMLHALFLKSQLLANLVIIPHHVYPVMCGL